MVLVKVHSEGSTYAGGFVHRHFSCSSGPSAPSVASHVRESNLRRSGLYIRESRIGSEAAQRRADDAKDAYCHVFCGRAKSACAYDEQGLVNRKHANLPCFAEVNDSLVLHFYALHTCPSRITRQPMQSWARMLRSADD